MAENDPVQQAGVLRKLSVIFEQQDRVDESHEAWSLADHLLKAKKFGNARQMEFCLESQKSERTWPDKNNAGGKAAAIETPREIKAGGANADNKE